MEKVTYTQDGSPTPLKHHTAYISLDILAADFVMAEETLNLLLEHFKRFSDLVNVNGGLV